MINIGGFLFDLYEGTVEVPKWSGVPYVQPGVPNVGIHMQPPAGTPFGLLTTRFDAAEYFEANQRRQRDKIGLHAYIIADGINYEIAPYRLRFFVLDVRIVSAEIIPMAAGSRNGSTYEHSPASKVVSEWILVAVPLS
ncbi:hypothetical protein RMSM_02564 [Rhodopirellula maiorica SM1]|uniref:Uncharacterized protein n=1 Tax=Rhodopirellula maiorica SM1 TaxID=1265738 RepID=M5RYQ4_9BACT|nr:hypothetical protein [Rhodopirellula maiorica]EMI20532.1 hypothetical protein RMSM_02564 [Rhodopirellula maiorica SM1]